MSDVIDWDNPTARLALIERVGPAEYNRLMAEHRAATARIVNGHPVSPVKTRFGTLWRVAGTDRAFAAFDDAAAYADSLPPDEEGAPV